MRIIVNDFAGHPFQFQLSRELCRRGHHVMHTYFADLSGPKGKLTVDDGDAGRLQIEPVRIGGRFSKYSYGGRLKAHWQYFRVLRKKMREFHPDVVISGNMPTDAQYFLHRECLRHNVRFVHWIQDFYALALETLFRRRFGPLGGAAAAPFHHLERRMFKDSDAVVYISDDFSHYAASSKYSPKRSVVIENWASLDDIPQRPKDNQWSRKHGLADNFVFLYSGTMGLKHSPETLAELARKFKAKPEVRVVLVSEGIGRGVLEETKKKEHLDNLILLDFQPYAELPDVLASADVVLASVEPDSSVFSVPSKILSYLCAGRPVLISVPAENLAARIVRAAQAGHVCNPTNPAEFLAGAESLWADRESCAQMGANARRYAESTFDIAKIGTVFEAVLSDQAAASAPVTNPLAMRVSQ